MQRSFHSSFVLIALVMAVAWAMAACANPLGSTVDPDEPEVASTSPARATPTRAAMMPIVTPTPIPAGATVPAPDRRDVLEGSENPDSYIVAEGDTLYAIALRFGVEIRTIIELNGLSDPNDIWAGQELQIPPREQ